MKPHYLVRGGIWWKFPSLTGARKFVTSMKNKNEWLEEFSPSEVGYKKNPHWTFY
jgi:hypothetical protein